MNKKLLWTWDDGNCTKKYVSESYKEIVSKVIRYLEANGNDIELKIETDMYDEFIRFSYKSNWLNGLQHDKYCEINFDGKNHIIESILSIHPVEIETFLEVLTSEYGDSHRFTITDLEEL